MTIVVAVQTTDSLVLASDSATTQQLPTQDGEVRTSSIWNSANKIVNLRKCWPVGAMTFGRATLKGWSIANHCKDLRARISGEVDDPDFPAFAEQAYSIKQIAEYAHSYFGRLYADEPGGMLGFLIGGFSAELKSPETWEIMITEDRQEVQQRLPPGEAGILHHGVTDAITRLVDGAGQGLGLVLAGLGVPADQAEPAADAVRNTLSIPWAWSGMPVGETIDLARFLVDTTIKFVRFMPGDATVGGPIEIAALAKHEGFKWVERKHYYSADLNPIRT